LFFHRGEFESSLAHFWSLSVEQQFYLIWPFVILVAPLRRLEAILLAAALVAPITRLTLYQAGFREFAQFNVLPLANLDSLALGAFVALCAHMPEPDRASRWRVLTLAAGGAAAALVANRLLGPLPANLEQSFYAVLFAGLVAAARRGLPGIAGRCLQADRKSTRL